MQCDICPADVKLTSFLQLLRGVSVCYYADPSVSIFEMGTWSEKCLKVSSCCVKKTAGLPGQCLMSGQSISPSVSMTRLDVFKETSQQFPAMFVATEVDILNQNMLCTSLCPAGL